MVISSTVSIWRQISTLQPNNDKNCLDVGKDSEGEGESNLTTPCEIAENSHDDEVIENRKKRNRYI